MEFLVFIALLLVGFFAGRWSEQQHFASIQQRERQTAAVSVFNIRASQDLPAGEDACLFVGSVVISGDYYKAVSGLIATLIGGAMPEYETLLERGRREAILRMKEAAIAWGATHILNVRLESISLDGNWNNNSLLSIEVMAYGTGIRGGVVNPPRDP